MRPTPPTARAIQIGLFCGLVALLALTVATATAHVPSVESGTAGEDGSGAEAATPIGGPEKSRAVYGHLSAGEVDAYAFSVDDPLTRTIGLIVPAYDEHQDFRPTLVAEEDGAEIARADDPGLVPREREFEPFSLTWFWVGAEDEFTFEPGVEYVLTVEPGVGDDASGRYVLVIGGPEDFSGSDIGATLTSLPSIWFGRYGDAPLRWNWLALVPAAFLLAAVAFVGLLVRSAARSRRASR